MATVISNRAAFDQALADQNKILLVVMGNSQGMGDVAKSADKAILFPEAQAAVWVQDVSILTAAELGSYQPGDPEYIACALSRPPRRVCARLSRPKALALFFMKAVKAAQDGTQPPVDMK
jgi:hypothetical protein